jgi:hypothetical protein
MSRNLARGLICLSILALLVAGCGEPTDDASNAGGSPQQTDSLKLEVRARAGADAQSATLRCGQSPEATGYITDAAAACKVVDASKHVLIHGPPDNIACTEIYGGPQQARITGAIDGQRVDLEVTRENGCEIALWDELEQILDVASET